MAQILLTLLESMEVYECCRIVCIENLRLTFSTVKCMLFSRIRSGCTIGTFDHERQTTARNVLGERKIIQIFNF